MSYRDKVKQRAMRKLAARHRETVMRVIDSAQTLARAAEHLKREYYHAYYGWDSRQEWIRPLPETVSNFIYRLEGPRTAKASQILIAWLPVAAQGWMDRYGWLPVHWETLIGQGDAKNMGACFKRAGFRSLGLTTGRSARRPPGHTHGARIWMDSTPKLVLLSRPVGSYRLKKEG